LEEIRLEHAVAAYLPPGKGLRLTLTSNRYNIVAVRREPAAYAVRVHQIFAAAEPRLVRALARYVVHNDRRASGVLGEFIERHENIISQSPRRPRQVKLRPAGRFYDLQDIFDRLNRRYFEGKLQAQITWGPAAFRPQQRSIKMGSFLGRRSHHPRASRAGPRRGAAFLRRLDCVSRDASRPARDPPERGPALLPSA
jgi:hypothetical protein